MNTIKYAIVAAILALPAAAQAQPVNGVYIGAGAGANWRANISEGSAQGSRLTIGTDLGFVGLVSVGYGFGNGLRAELEGNYRSNPVGTTTVRGRNGATVTSSSGSLSTYGGMANLFYDFNLASLGAPTVSPYLGAGIGFGINGVSDISGRTNAGAFANTGALANAANVSASGGGLAYQAIAGIAIGLGQYVPGLALTTEYRYLATTTSELQVTFNSGNITSRTNYTPNNTNHAVLIGLRYAFNVPPAPVAAVAPAPRAVARTYLAFFDWNRADLTPRVREIIAEAAQNAGTLSVTRIEVGGHADRSGSDAYNMALSQRRANAVAADLVARGISRSAITVQAFGESRPLVATADGVREPQNRRVEIILR